MNWLLSLHARNDRDMHVHACHPCATDAPPRNHHCAALFPSRTWLNMVVSLSSPLPPSMAAVPNSHGVTSHSFNPYTDNGGSIMAIAGKDFCVVAGDTRQSEGYNIQTRYKPKVFRL